MKKKWLVCALCMLSVGFMSCSDDDDDENGGEGGLGPVSGQPATEAPSVGGAGIQFPVTSFSETYGSPFYYYYENGKMVQGWSTNGYAFQIESNPLTIRAGYGDESDVYKNIRVNASGFITYCEFHYREDDGIEGVGTVSCNYDGEGHLISSNGTFKDNDGYNDSFTCTYTWENGNLVKREESDVEDYDGEVDEWHWVYEMVYDESKYPNSGVFYDMEESSDYFFEEFFFYAGMLGRCSKNIPVMFREGSNSNGESYNHTVEITNVVYNPDGSIKTINRNMSGSNYSFNYGYDPVTPDRSVKSVPVAGKTMKSKMLRRLQERRAK